MNWPSAVLSFAKTMPTDLNSGRRDVLFVLKIPPPFGGGEIMHQVMAEALAQKYPLLVFSRREHNKAKQGKVLPANLFFGIYLMVRVISRCLRRRPRVVFLWLPKDWPAFVRTALLAAALHRLGIQVIGDLHGMDFAFMDQLNKCRFYLKYINHFSAVRVLSESIAATIHETGYLHHIEVIDNGLPTPAFVLSAPVEKTLRPLRLLYLGAVSAAKGFADVVKMLTDLEQIGIEWRLTVVGEWVSETFRGEMTAKIAGNGLASRIHFAGLRIGDEKWRALTESDLLLHFSRWDGQPLTIIEAMAAGVPTLAYAVGAIPEMITHGQNGFLIKTWHEALPLLSALCLERISYQSLAANARLTYQNRFTAETFIEKIERLVLGKEHAADFSIPRNR
jgi:glycosyltransferase involved in cell wall biosynthesis